MTDIKSLCTKVDTIYCEHLHSEAKGVAEGLWLGESVFLLVCPLCWSSIKGLVLERILHEAIKEAHIKLRG